MGVFGFCDTQRPVHTMGKKRVKKEDNPACEMDEGDEAAGPEYDAQEKEQIEATAATLARSFFCGAAWSLCTVGLSWIPYCCQTKRLAREAAEATGTSDAQE